MPRIFSKMVFSLLVFGLVNISLDSTAQSCFGQDKKAEESKPKQEQKKTDQAEKKPAEKKQDPEAKTDDVVKIKGFDKVKVETAANGLFNPCGVTIQPETGTVFVADSGNLRIMRMLDGKLVEVITSFPKDVYGKGPKYQIGPLGLAFLDKDTLVVGGGGQVDGKEQLYVFKVPAADKPAIKAADAVQKMSLPAEGDFKRGEGNFYAIAVTSNAVFVTLNGDDTKGWVGRADRKGDKLSNFKRSLATKVVTAVDAPVGITQFKFKDNNKEEEVLAVGQMGEITKPGDSLLTYYKASDNREVGNFQTGLSDITALAFSKPGHLYALDFCWHDTTKGGLFRLVSKNDEEVTSKLVCRLDKPTAMVFDKDGNLWVTVVGTAKGDDKGGRLLKVSGFHIP